MISFFIFPKYNGYQKISTFDRCPKVSRFFWMTSLNDYVNNTVFKNKSLNFYND